jgi:hypothetical protein
MRNDSTDTLHLTERLRGGDREALTELFRRHRDLLLRLVQPRIDAPLQGRVDASDVLQDAFLDAAARLSRSDFMVRRAVCLEGHVRICGSPGGAIPWGHPAQNSRRDAATGPPMSLIPVPSGSAKQPRPPLQRAECGLPQYRRRSIRGDRGRSRVPSRQARSKA